MYSFDINTQNYFSLARTSSLTEFLYLSTYIFDFSFHFVILIFFLAVLIYLMRNIQHAFLFFGSLFSGGVIVYLMKAYFNVSRPVDSVIIAFGKSFPSYHATIATIFFLMLIYIFDDYMNSFFKILFNALAVLSILTIAFSRVYLGVHYVSDVVVGVVLGGLISYISVKIFKRFDSGKKYAII
jgi:undecaprenyl-diphosphatase